LDYRIDYKKSVAKDLKRIGKADAKRIMNKIDKDLVHDPGRFPALSGPFAGMRKYRVGDYRVIFVIMDDSVLILRIQDRRDVYRKR
jgi:mRNA interferase RelE/StbE